MNEIYERMVNEYEKAIEILTERIKRRNKRLRQLPPYSNETSVLRHERQVLYDERNEARQTVQILRQYAEAT